MTERLHISEALLAPHASLNPVRLVHALSRRHDVTLGKFRTNLLIRYLPNVSTETAGSVAFAASPTPHSTLSAIAALQPSYTGPVWRPATLNVPKTLLNTQSWLAADSESFYLAAAGHKGTFTITVTLSLTTTTIVRSPLYELTTLDLHAYVGPRLEGFSLAFVGPENVARWRGGGIVMNVDLTRGLGRSKDISQGFVTPDNKPYVAVRFGTTGAYTFTVNSQNSNYFWNEVQMLDHYVNLPAPPGAITGLYFGTWRPIHGSTDYWARVQSKAYSVLVDANYGPRIDTYYTYGILILYYSYPNVDIFSETFSPFVPATHGNKVPNPSGNVNAHKEATLSPLRGVIPTLWSPYWLPLQNPTILDQLARSKDALMDWPIVNASGT